MVAGAIYLAATDGFLVVVPNQVDWSYHSVWTGTTSPPNFLAAQQRAFQPSGSMATSTVPISAGTYYQVRNDYGNAPTSITFYAFQ